jgi:hypothetical protein
VIDHGEGYGDVGPVAANAEAVVRLQPADGHPDLVAGDQRRAGGHRRHLDLAWGQSGSVRGEGIGVDNDGAIPDGRCLGPGWRARRSDSVGGGQTTDQAEGEHRRHPPCRDFHAGKNRTIAIRGLGPGAGSGMGV